MPVVNTQPSYDHPHFRVRRFSPGVALAAGTLVPTAFLLGVQALELYKVQGYITAAGTATANTSTAASFWAGLPRMVALP